jgi:hypothetical protein
VNRGELRAELKSRIGDFLSDTRANRLLNEAYLEICDRAWWAFLEATASGTAPLTISDLRAVLYVVDTTNGVELRGIDVRDLIDLDPSLSSTGTPQFYWLDGLTTLKVWPLNTTASLSVRYVKTPAELSSDSDTPLLPSRFQLAIVDLAQARALATGPNGTSQPRLEQAQAAQASADRKLLQMQDMLIRRLDSPDFLVQTEFNNA